VDEARRNSIRAALERQRAELVALGDVAIEPEADGEVVEKPDEDAAPLTEMNQVIASNRNREHAARLARIDDALARLRTEPDAFGICEGCDDPIPLPRLELIPWVRLCAACQAEAEAEGMPAGRKHITDYR
jgi:DnaK suppressor protein